MRSTDILGVANMIILGMILACAMVSTYCALRVEYRFASIAIRLETIARENEELRHRLTTEPSP